MSEGEYNIMLSLVHKRMLNLGFEALMNVQKYGSAMLEKHSKLGCFEGSFESSRVVNALL